MILDFLSKRNEKHSESQATQGERLSARVPTGVPAGAPDGVADGIAQDNQVASEAVDTEPRQGAARLLRAVGTLGLYAAVVLLPITVVAALVFTGQTLYTSILHLGTATLVVDPKLAEFAAASMLAMLGVLIASGIGLSRIGKRRTLLIAGLFAIVWLAVTVVLALVDSWISNKLIDADETLLRIGTFIYSALPALPAIPIVALAYSASHEREDQYQTIRAAVGAMGLTLLKAFGWVAMFAIESFYGISIGVNPIAAIFSALLNATAFTSALGNVEASVHDGDRGGVRLWGVVSVFYAVVMFSVAAEAIITFSGGRDGSLRAMNPPQWLEAFAQWAFVSSIGLSALLVAIALWRKAGKEMRSATGAGVDASTQPNITISKPSLAHRAGAMTARPRQLVDDFKRGRDSARDSARGPVPQLTAGDQAMVMASDAPVADALPDDKRADAHNASNGRPEFVGVVKPTDTKIVQAAGDWPKQRVDQRVDSVNSGGGAPGDTKSRERTGR
jgi:hypothetical protein